MNLPRLALYTCLFALGTAGAWLFPRQPAQDSAASTITASAPRGPAALPPDLPAPSGLPGDWIHLSLITDIRTLRAVWKTGDWREESALVERWAELDPEDGLRFFMFELENGAPRDINHASTVAESLAKRDPDGYLHFLAGRPGNIPYPFDAALHSLAKSRLESNPDAFLMYWRNAEDSIHNEVFRRVFDHLFSKDPARAIAEIAQLPPSERADSWASAYISDNPALVLPAFIAAGAATRNDYTFGRLIS